uniref:Transmembrane protein 120A n=1 Tax=Gopherus evgoodei TaxID=1825980 RepID=A0A8C4WT69_9SAUR
MPRVSGEVGDSSQRSCLLFLCLNPQPSLRELTGSQLRHLGSPLVCPFHCQEAHKLYKQKLEELTKLQDGISSSIARQKKQLKELSLAFKKKSIREIQSLIKERQSIFFEMEAYLPKKNGLYLSLVLGNVNVTLLSKQAKFAYKDEYEKFKLYLTIILLIISFSCRFLLNSRVTDAVFNFLLVWYYCTSPSVSLPLLCSPRIKGWWVFHHYVSTFLSGVMLTWPDGLMYQMFRNQFLSFSMYQSFVQFLQYYYQSGCLYRLRALGERHNMDLTVEGFQSWMWRGLTFLLPFLFFGQFWQLYNAVTLFRLARHPQCKEWQVLMCGLPFFVLFVGNFTTTLRVVQQKFQNQNQEAKAK